MHVQRSEQTRSIANQDPRILQKYLINDALNKGYEIWVRFKFTGDTTKVAETRENSHLDEYDYALNERRNGVRHILQ